MYVAFTHNTFIAILSADAAWLLLALYLFCCVFATMTISRVRVCAFTRFVCFAAEGGRGKKRVRETPRTPSGGLAALLHHPLFRHFEQPPLPGFSYDEKDKVTSIITKEECASAEICACTFLKARSSMCVNLPHANG